jgi:hypothetical protein
MAMIEDPRVGTALDEIAESGVTPEQACATCPEILPEVLRRWQRMNRRQCELDLLFPVVHKAPARRQSSPLHRQPSQARGGG